MAVELEGAYYNLPVTNGSFNATVNRCSNGAATAELTAYDIGNAQSGTPVNLPVSGSTINAGTLTACGVSLDSYIRYTLNGVPYQLAPPSDNLIGWTSQETSGITSIGGLRTGEGNIIFMFTGTKEPGVYPVILCDVNATTFRYVREGQFNTTITEFGGPVGFVTGNFSGVLRDSTTNSTNPINCSFRLQR